MIFAKLIFLPIHKCLFIESHCISSINKEYKAMFQEGTVDRITIVNDNNPKVKAYMEEVGIKCSVHNTSNAGTL